MISSSDVRMRLRHAAWQLAASALAIGIVALLMLRWYPEPYAALAGGWFLLAVLAAVQLVLGPVLGFIVAAPGKRGRTLWGDLVVIGLLQFAALGWGVWELAEARPVALVFEIDRFRLVTDADIDASLLREAPLSKQALSWNGPRLIAAQKPADSVALMQSIEFAMAGADLGQQPRHWVDYDPATAWRAAEPLDEWLRQHPELAPRVGPLLAAAGATATSVRVLPVLSRRADWVVLIGLPDARVLGHLAMPREPARR
jgi:hypothetical protein